ncbi:hypothetical protein TNCV_4357411 [Trichonephila clavipes]|nr:hypothetical protein TNCV_4357411 [Trichonephila clavipes]
MEPNLKNMLHHIIREEGRSWHGHIPFYTHGLHRSSKRNYRYAQSFLLMYGRGSERTAVYTEVGIWTGIAAVTSEYEGICRELFEKAKRKS